jgi:hypothetical protein
MGMVVVGNACGSHQSYKERGVCKTKMFIPGAWVITRSVQRHKRTLGVRNLAHSISFDSRIVIWAGCRYPGCCFGYARLNWTQRELVVIGQRNQLLLVWKARRIDQAVALRMGQVCWKLDLEKDCNRGRENCRPSLNRAAGSVSDIWDCLKASHMQVYHA